MKGDMVLRWRAVLILVAATALLAGCGIQQAVEGAVQNAVQNATESITDSVLQGTGLSELLDDVSDVLDGDIEGLDGGDSTLEPGSDSAVTPQEDQVDLRAQAGAGPIPDGFFLPVLPGMWTDGIEETVVDGKVNWVGTFYFEGDFAEMARAYQDALRDLGFAVAMLPWQSDGLWHAAFDAPGQRDGKQWGGLINMDEEDAGPGLHSLTISYGERED